MSPIKLKFKFYKNDFKSQNRLDRQAEREKDMYYVYNNFFDTRVCPVCGMLVERSNMNYTRDCHGITYRLVCFDCYNRLMSKGYDGEYYDGFDERIEPDYQV